MSTKIKARIEDLTPPVVLRLRFIDCMLGHYGNFNRHLLVDYFGLSTPQASIDINQYKTLAPDNMYYSGVTRQYVATPEFKPLWPTEGNLRHEVAIRQYISGEGFKALFPTEDADED